MIAHPYIGPALETEHFRHVEFKLPELVRMARVNSPEYVAAGSAYFDPRWKQIHKYVRTNPAIPQDVRDEAARYSRELVFSFTGFRSKIIRGQSHGALDSSRLARLASPGISAREFDRLALSAYRRREHVQSDNVRPRIAIVGDMNNRARSDFGYLKRLGKLAYTVGEAAKLSGVETALYGSRGFNGAVHGVAWKAARNVHGSINHEKRPHVVVTLKDWDGDISGSEYSIFTDSVPGGASIVFPVTLFQGLHLANGKADGMDSDSGAGGVEFARANGANIVIGFGTFSRHETPDLQFAPNDSIENVVRGIVAYLANRKAA